MADRLFQAGAVPYRLTSQAIEVLLISTSSGKHLTIPKGIIDPGFSAAQTALNEAYEEAGIKGDLMLPPIGGYQVKKWGGIWTVTVYAMAVTRMLNRWPEDRVRRRAWVEIRRAARLVKHDGLADVILKLPDRLKQAAARAE